MLEKRGPKSLRICTLLDKPACRVSEVDVAYTGFEIDDYLWLDLDLIMPRNTAICLISES